MTSHPLDPSDGPQAQAAAAPRHPSQSPLLVLLAWAVVALPAAWGIYMTARTSVQLFHPSASAPARAPTLTTPTPAQTPAPTANK